MTEWKVTGIFEMTVFADNADEAVDFAKELVNSDDISSEDMEWSVEKHDNQAHQLDDWCKGAREP